MVGDKYEIDVSSLNDNKSLNATDISIAYCQLFFYNNFIFPDNMVHTKSSNFQNLIIRKKVSYEEGVYMVSLHIFFALFYLEMSKNDYKKVFDVLKKWKFWNLRDFPKLAFLQGFITYCYFKTPFKNNIKFRNAQQQQMKRIYETVSAAAKFTYQRLLYLYFGASRLTCFL